MAANSKTQGIRATLMLVAAAIGWFWGGGFLSVAFDAGPQSLPGSADAAWARFSPDGRLVVGGAGESASVWDVEKNSAGSALPAAPPGDRILSAAFSPDGTRLALGLSDGSAHVYLWKTRALLKKFNTSGAFVREVAFTSGGRHLWTRSSGVEVWDLDSGKAIARPGAGLAIAASAAEDVVAVASGGEIQLYSGDGRERLARISDFDGAPAALAFSPDGLHLALALSEGEVRIWSAKGKFERALTKPDATLASLAWSSDSKYLAAGARDGRLLAWNAITGVFALEHQDEDVRPGGPAVLEFEPGTHRLLYSLVTKETSELRIAGLLGGAQ
ncbi:MAG: hypothetical protein KDH09_06270 [Chrysiogenetes bacterium]|nr:hypothetical protein [Chrysiogenetes bacterium]